MLTAREIEEYPLEKSFGGYKTEAVDDFLDKVAADFQKLTDDNAALSKKITVLVESVNKYRQDEEYIKSTLVEAQKSAAVTVANATDEADTICSDAKAQADEILANANAEAEAIIEKANADVSAALEEGERKIAVLENYYTTLQKQVDEFKNQLLSTYKSHIESISALPSYEEEDEEQEIKAVDFEEVFIEDIPEIDKAADEFVLEAEGALDEEDEEEFLEEIEVEESAEPEKVEE